MYTSPRKYALQRASYILSNDKGFQDSPGTNHNHQGKFPHIPTDGFLTNPEWFWIHHLFNGYRSGTQFCLLLNYFCGLPIIDAHKYCDALPVNMHFWGLPIIDAHKYCDALPVNMHFWGLPIIDAHKYCDALTVNMHFWGLPIIDAHKYCDALTLNMHFCFGWA